MTVEIGEFYYLVGAAAIFLAAIIVYNWVGGRKKAKKE